MGSSDEEIASQLAKKKKRVEGSAVGKAKKAEPKRKRLEKIYLYYWDFANEEEQCGFSGRRLG